MRRTGVSGAFAIFALGLVLSGGASGRSPTQPSCPAGGQHVVARGNDLSVYAPGKSGSPAVPVVACLAGRQTGMTLIAAPSPHSRRPVRRSLGIIVVAGPIAAYVVN